MRLRSSSTRSRGERDQVAAELLDLVAQLRRVLEAQLLGRLEHLLLERDHELLELLARHAPRPCRRRAAARARHVRLLEREELGDVGDALVIESGFVPCSSL